MNRKCVTYILLFCLLVSIQEIWAQGYVEDSDLYRTGTESRLFQFLDELNELSENLTDEISDDKLQEIDKSLNTLSIKWNTYFQIRQNEIAEDDVLLELVSDYQQLRQAVIDSIQVQRHHREIQNTFHEAELFISAQDSVYEKMSEHALELSLIESFAPQLEKLKGKEQLLFADIQKQYEAAKGVVAEQPALQSRMEEVESQYIELKNASEKIQAMAYKPLFQRIKDYLFGLAAVAIVLMFISMIQSKIQMLKRARESAKKLEQMMNKDNEDYPTI